MHRGKLSVLAPTVIDVQDPEGAVDTGVDHPGSDTGVPAAAALAVKLLTTDITGLGPADTLDAIALAKQVTAIAEARVLAATAHFADLHPAQILEHRTVTAGSGAGDDSDDDRGWDGDETDVDRARRWVGGHEPPPGGLGGAERVVRVGGEGTPEVAEFTSAQLGPVLRASTISARFLLADALDLRHRLPRIHVLVVAGKVDLFRARWVAQATRKLTSEQARLVEERVIGRLGRVTPAGLRHLIDTEILNVDPKAADAERELARAARQVGINPGEDGVGNLWARCDNHTLARLDERITAVAGWLAETGDSDPVRLRRVTALGLLADPSAVAALWETVQTVRSRPATRGNDNHNDSKRDNDAADDPERDLATQLGSVLADRGRVGAGLPGTVLYVHLRSGPDGVPRFDVERGGAIPARPLTLTWARELLGHSHVTIRPILDLAAVPAASGYAPTMTQREALHLLNGTCCFPYCDRTSRGTDADHLIPAPRGPTDMANLGPADRHHHRCKTHAPGWIVTQPFPTVYVWRAPTGHHYAVTPRGTTSLGRC